MSQTSCSNGFGDRVVGLLIVAKITQGAAGGYAEYLDGKAQPTQLGDYYLKDGERIEAPGRWAAGAERFGLGPTERVTGEQLRTLMDVRRPDTGQELRRVGGTGEAVAAIDATFSAPKSVSAVWALAGAELRDQIETAHETAIDRALDYATRQVPMLRRRVSQDTAIHEKATGLIATSWRHTTARAVGDQVPDPQLHSHVLLHAAILRDGRVVAIDSRAWLVHQREVGAAYRTELARQLNQLGFRIERGTGRGGRYFELDGIPQPLIDRWSSRHHQVQAAIRERLADQEHELNAAISAGGPGAVDAARQLQALQESGQLSPKQERMMGTATRSAKPPITTHDLDAAWRQTALPHHLSRERIDVLRHQARDPLEAASAGEVLAGLTEFDATFPARDARAVALERSAGAPIETALEQLRGLRAADEILVLADGTGTTRAHRGRERTVVAITQRLAGTQTTPLPTGVAEREADRLDQELATRGGRLSDEQRAAIRVACGPQPFVVIEGQAGTGKSTALTGIARAHQGAGQEILVTSTGALAAERLASELNVNGVDSHAYSTAALTTAVVTGRVALTPQTTIIHDEAALASTREQLDLLDAVETSGARLIAVGDPQQNQPVGAGGLWHPIETAARDAGAHVELTRNQRAHDPADRRDQALFRAGHAERAIRGYAARDHIHFHDDPRRAEDHALEAAHADRANGKSTIVIAQTSNDHLDALNARAQAIRHQAGELGDEALQVPGRPYQLRAGDHVQIRRTIQHPSHGPVRNGASALVTDVARDASALELRLADGAALRLTEQQVAHADLRLAYAQHPFPAQGHTTDTSHLIVGQHATREGTYVGLTRARKATGIYVGEVTATTAERDDRLQSLADHLARSEPDAPSIRTPLTQTRAAADQTLENSIPPIADGRNLHSHASTSPDSRDRSLHKDDRVPITLADERRTPSHVEPVGGVAAEHVADDGRGDWHAATDAEPLNPAIDSAERTRGADFEP